ncbi:DUF5325 family protein [Paenibacillus senegalensis]|uniref:DUF5325 family protein n=1 Tax=Paenibacillus senegalensis TaxID=1465766 RepID=UPI0002897C62|nr:DUF5325 family protein [Paenibacillus senegalensis]
MQRIPALIFSVIGVLLMIGISVSISLHKPWLVLVFSLATILFIGLGFVYKAKARKRNNS